MYGGAEALNRIQEERLLCSPRHGVLQGGVVGVGEGANEDFLEGVEALAPLSPARSPARLTQRPSCRRAAPDQQARSAGAVEEDSELGVLEQRW